MKKLLSLFILSTVIISCSEKDPVVDENSSGDTVEPSNFGTISSMPNQFLIKKTPDVGKWNLSANNSQTQKA
ncbi:MAG: hypothetical protein CM15mP32_6540 [Flavobacteriaceae bacterium]|nr:MAG: hypothetical protein CM15mP32_6540 [Flavobacteriaceae bacterium]